MNPRTHAKLSDLAYTSPKVGKDGEYDPVKVDGVEYKVIAHSDTRSGYQGTVYQNTLTKEFIVAHRGTEFDRQPGLDGAVDFGMIGTRANAQANDAIKLTEIAIDRAHQEGSAVSVTGHSLGGALAQITAHRFNLPGNAFNPFGSVSLGYRIPEGSPAGAAPFTNHVMAGDVVSAASPHYGKVEMYALPSELSVLRQSQMIHGNPLFKLAPGIGTTAQVADVVRMVDSHRMHHFLDVDGKGNPDRSVLDDSGAKIKSPEDLRLVQDFRDRVSESRLTASVIMRGPPGLFSGIADHLRGPEMPGVGLSDSSDRSAARQASEHSSAYSPTSASLNTQLDELLHASSKYDQRDFVRLNELAARQPAGIEFSELACTQVDQMQAKAATERTQQQSEVEGASQSPAR